MPSQKISQDTTVIPTGADIVPIVQLGSNANSTFASFPISTATQSAINGKQDTLVSGTNIKTVNSTSLLGSGDIVISGSVADGDKGDITVSGSGATWTIDNSVVTTTKLGGDITTAGKALLDDADASAQRTTLGLGTLATQSGTFSGASSGTNTGDNATNTTYTTLATTLSTSNTWSAVQTFLTGMFGLRNVANTFTSFFTNTNTASRTYTLKDASGTLAFTTDITGTNSGTNTGNQTITNTSDGTSHTATLSATGGSLKLVEGTNITLTTTGTSSDGIVTIAATGGSGLTNFTEGVNTSAPNATVPVVSMTATNAAANVDVAIVPKGTGALITAIPDNLTAGGNKRGNYAIDIQTLRTANTQVAAGTEAVVIGSGNTATLANSIAIGKSNSATKAESMAIGVLNNATGANQSNAVGYSNTASGDNSSAFGSSCSSTGQYSNSFGYVNIASGVRATAIGGGEGTAQSFGETVMGLFPTTGAGTSGSYVSTDRLLVVGNGTAAGSRSNAITVLKNGNTTIAGTVGASNLSGTNTGDQTITLTGAVTGSGTGSFATTIATPGTVTVSSTNSTATAHTHAVTSSSAPGASASLLATDASGHIGSTGTRIAKIWATDITVTNAIAGSITGNAATVTTNANLTGHITSTGNATVLGSFTMAQLDAAVNDGNVVYQSQALGTPASGTLTNCTGLPVAGITSSTSTALGVGSIELGHASDTSITRVSAGVIAVEGVTVPTLSSTSTLTNKTLTTPTISKPVMSATNPTAQTYAPAAGGTATLDLSLSDQHDITMPAGNITIALSNDTNNQLFMITTTQDATGSRTVTWFSTIKWAGGSAPTLTTTASKRDMFGFKRTGSGTYDGFVIAQNI